MLPLKRAGCYCIFLVFILATAELCAWVFFKKFQQYFTFFDLQRYFVTEEKQANISRSAVGKELYLAWGWDMSFETPHGERPRNKSYNSPFIATFGDSYTHCDQVEDHQTWQTHLSDLLRLDVYNFGVGGYGTDQAYLKFLSKYPELPTPLVFLGLITENINRIVNVFRPFYFPNTGIPTAKPRFVLKDNSLVIIENPLRTTSDISKLGDPQFIQKIGEYDWWYNRDNYPVLGFPYLKILLNKRMWLEAYYGKAHHKIDDMNPRPWENLWNSEEASNLMFKILDAFVEKAKTRQAIPVIVVLPLQDEVKKKFITKEHTSNVKKILSYCESQGYPVFDAITVLANSMAVEEDIFDLYVGHVSPKGNQIIAKGMYDYLKKELPDVIARHQEER